MLGMILVAAVDEIVLADEKGVKSLDWNSYPILHFTAYVSSRES
jgi:hypothetical protein